MTTATKAETCAQHTPGPWIVDDGTIEAPFEDGTGSKVIGSVLTGLTSGVHRVGSKAEQKANARLIAASPQMFEACRLAQKILIVNRIGRQFPELMQMLSDVRKATGY